jgi:hypothetical protein
MKLIIEVFTNDPESIHEGLAILNSLTTEGKAVPTNNVQPLSVVTNNVQPFALCATDSLSDVTEDQDHTYLAGEKDSEGMPWDERIHGKNKAKTKQGVFKKQRGVDEMFARQCQEETTVLLESTELPEPVTATVPSPVADPALAAAAVIAPPPPPPNNTVTVADVVPTAVVPPASGWGEFLAAISVAQTAGTYNEPRMTQLLEHYGIADIPFLQARSDLWSVFLEDEYLIPKAE